MRKRELYEFAFELWWEEVERLSDGVVGDVVVVGDIHGDEHHLTNAIDQAADLGADAVVQVGDFWLGTATGAASTMSSPLTCTPRTTRLSRSLSSTATTRSGRRWAGTRSAPKHALRSSRGGRCIRAGRSGGRGEEACGTGQGCGALGGSVSLDRRDPTVRHRRWDDEAPAQDDLEQLITNADGRLDVLFTHDAPAQVQNLKSGMTGIPWDIQHAADNGRRRLAEAVDRTQPTYVPHGHWRQANQERISECTEVIGLAEDGRRNSNAWLTTQPELHASYAA